MAKQKAGGDVQALLQYVRTQLKREFWGKDFRKPTKV